MLFLHQGLVSVERVKAVLNLTQTTSPSYLLLTSLDGQKANGPQRAELVQNALSLADGVRKELGSIEGPGFLVRAWPGVPAVMLLTL